MTVSTLDKGYLEAEYLGDDYLTGLAEGSLGSQIEFKIVNFERSIGKQSLLTIVDELKALGLQSEFSIVDFLDERGNQAEFLINSQDDSGQQALLQLVERLNSQGMQANLTLLDRQLDTGSQSKLVINQSTPLGMQASFALVSKLNNSGQQANLFILTEKPLAQEIRVDDYPTLICGNGYLEDGYLLGPYLTQTVCLIPGQQTLFTIVDAEKVFAQQAEFSIEDYLNIMGQQSEFTIEATASLGMQFDSVVTFPTAQQVLSTIYNTTNLRILCEFPSRGVTNSNWSSTSTAPGDFSPQNLDTDIVEQVWRSVDTVITGVRISSDTGLPQGVFLDTFAILNHNMTRSASVTLLGSNDAGFATIGVSIVLDARSDNMYYVAPVLPSEGFRYWRVDIDDATNSDDFISIGTIIFGASNIFQGECFVENVDFQLQDFTDSVATEAFTHVSNSRALKRKVRLEFRLLNFQKNNFKIMRSLFETYRTTHKCLWIPTPSADDVDLTARFAGFAKLTTLPSERHTYKGKDADYVSFTIEYDESK